MEAAGNRHKVRILQLLFLFLQFPELGLQVCDPGFCLVDLLIQFFNFGIHSLPPFLLRQTAKGIEMALPVA